MHGSAVHVPHCATLPARHSLSQQTTPCRDSKQLVILPQDGHPYFVPHCYSLRPHDCLTSSTFAPAIGGPDSPNTVWELDARKAQMSRSSMNSISRSKHNSMIPVPVAMPPLSISPNLQECEEKDDALHESFNQARADGKDGQQTRQYASVV